MRRLLTIEVRITALVAAVMAALYTLHVSEKTLEASRHAYFIFQGEKPQYSKLVLYGMYLWNPNVWGDACINHLREIDGAKQQWALQYNKGPKERPSWKDIRPLLGRGSAAQIPLCPSDGVYFIGTVDEAPTCSIKEHTLN